MAMFTTKKLTIHIDSIRSIIDEMNFTKSMSEIIWYVLSYIKFPVIISHLCKVIENVHS